MEIGVQRGYFFTYVAAAKFATISNALLAQFSDILRVCHHRNCQGMGMKRDEMLARAQGALREVEELIPFTGREGDKVEYLKKFHEVSYMMRDFGSALAALKEEIDIAVTKLPKTWQFEERVIRPDTDHVAQLFTQLCALQFELQQVTQAREVRVCEELCEERTALARS